MKMKKMAALIISFIMISSLFAGFTVTTYAADKATVALEVYHANEDGTFGNKMDLSKEKLKVGDEFIVAIQVYDFDKLVGAGGLCFVQLELNYNSNEIHQAMSKASKSSPTETGYYDEEKISISGSRDITSDYPDYAYVKTGSAVLEDEMFSTDPDVFNKDLRWFSLKDEDTNGKVYDDPSVLLKKVTNASNEWDNYGVKIVTNVASAGTYSANGTLRATGGNNKMMFAYKFVAHKTPESGSATISLQTAVDSSFIFSKWPANIADNVMQSSEVQRYSQLVSGGIMNEVTPLAVTYDLPATDAPTGSWTTYDATNNKRTVNVTSNVTNTTIKVYADAAKTKLIKEGTKGSASIDVERATATGDSDIVKALNTGKAWITATEDGKGESTAVALTATARPNESKLTAAPTVTGSYSVKVNGAVTSAGLPSSISVPFTYNSSNGVETGTINYSIPVTWAWETGSNPTAAGTAVAKATWGNAPAGLTKQENIATFAPSVNVTVTAASYTGATATSPATETAQSAYAKGWTTDAALKAWLDANVKVNTTKEGGATATESTAWTLKSGTFDVKGGTYTYESGAFGTHKATITVKVTPVTGTLGPRAKDTEISVTALDEETLQPLTRPTTEDALKALAPTTANVYYGDAADPLTGQANLSWTVKELKAGEAALADGDVMGTLIRTVTLPADLAWLTVTPNAAPDEVVVKAKLALGGVRASAANMPDTENDMVRVTVENQETAIMKKLVAKEGAIIEVYNSKEDSATPAFTFPVTAADVAANMVLYTTDDFKEAGSTRYVGINYNGMKTPAESRIQMTVQAEPKVTLTGTATSVKEGATITETAQLNSGWTFVADSQTWTSNAEATLTATANADKSTAAIKGIAAGNATVTFTAKVAHPFAAELLAADPDATNAEVELTATKAYTVTKKSTPPTPTDPVSPGTRPGSSGNKGTGGVVVVPSNTQYFIDIDNITWAKDKINALAEKGIVEGVADKIFAPNNTVTRAEFAKMIVGAFGIYDTNATMNFADTNGMENEWYYKYVASAAKRGIILGYEEDNTFRPSRTISREEMCAIVVRACKATGRTLVQKHQPITFDDDASIMGYAKESVDLMTGAGIIDGMGENMFVPKGSATRAQAAKIIYDVTIG